MNKDIKMSLADALDVGPGAVVSLVGGGGKTTSMFRLAGELAARGLRVVTTTSTHISREQVELSPAVVSTGCLSRLGPLLDRHGQCLVVGAPDDRDRVFGSPPEEIALLAARADVDVVVIEADGSRSLPFKAPAEHEPVVHPLTTLLVAVAGIDILGAPLDEEHVHRARRAAALAGVPEGVPVTAEIVARVLAHPLGGAKGRPDGARFVPLVNRADDAAAAARGREILALLVQHPGVDRALLCSLLQPDPVIERREKVK
jgi:molybdenum cofactor cytidylyltransferase